MFLFPKIYVGFWLVSMAGLGAAAWLGWRSGAGGPPMLLALHMLIGLGAAFLNLLLHTAVMMHTVGTGRALKLAQPHLDTDRDFVEEQLRYKNRSYPVAALTSVAVVVTAILGGAANFGAADVSVHRAFFWAAIGLNLLALPLQYRVTSASAEINAEVESLLKDKVEALEKEGRLPPPGMPMPWQTGD